MTPVFDPWQFSVVASDVLSVGYATPSAILARQQRRLAHVMALAQCRSRLYRERLRGLTPGQTPLQALPVVTRGELMQRFDDWVTDPQLKLDELRAFMADAGRVAEPYLGRYMVWESSGTSAQPGLFVQDAQAMAVYDALETLRRHAPRPLRRWVDPWCVGERIAFVGATNGHFASYVSVQRLRQINPWMAQAMQSFSILQSAEALVAGLNAFWPTVIACYPTVASLLAEQARSGALRVRPREVWTGGENLSPAVRQSVTQAWDCSLRNSYGASEFLSIAWECRQGCLHANADWVILEPVDEQRRPVPAGQTPCTTLLTHLAQTVQPLLRYDLGDQVTVHAERCACGSPLPVIEVQGRGDAPLVMAGRGGRKVTLLPLALTTVLEDQAGVFDFQLRQRDAHTLVLRLDLQGGDAAAAMARCRAALSGFAEVLGLQPIRVIEELGQVPRGRSGKVCRVLAAEAA
ncbi:phenylacetate--CoA ligase family protein [Ramlibacter sp. 2FC]|uniref:phenylacetate--CoA ligase family protein n=1 Tax=Ramlibacter sp. 2FC TaxID=2502188 RepID=UPI0010F4A777|nr:phenylacetate--CoA ligase family protein [Ramlibacter sp. 2FC]